jgi:hypothetical protein
LAVIFAALIGRYIRASDWLAAGPSYCGQDEDVLEDDLVGVSPQYKTDYIENEK